jgi:UDP-galactopyranose mutase
MNSAVHLRQSPSIKQHIPSRHILIVGAGFAGSVSARLLAEAGCTVQVIEKRPHVGGNAFDRLDEAGVLIHPYGPHIFHTNSFRVVRFLSRFTDWRFYEHRVLASVNGALYPIPINRTTVNRLYGLSLDERGVEAYFAQCRSPREPIRNSEDLVLNSVGPDLCDKFFRGYTRKQWGLDLSELSAGVAARIPTRTNDDDRYFTDEFQMMPADGYTAMFSRLLDHPLIEVHTDIDFFKVRDQIRWDHLIYTGPVDQFFDQRFGALPYRSLRFDHEHLADRDSYQDVGTVNYPNDFDFTRITEFKKLTGQDHRGTSIVREYPQAVGEPFYPIPRPENEALYKRYQNLADNESDVSFIGRLAQYRYFNMDQVVASSLTKIEDLLRRWELEQTA